MGVGEDLCQRGAPHDDHGSMQSNEVVLGGGKSDELADGVVGGACARVIARALARRGPTTLQSKEVDLEALVVPLLYQLDPVHVQHVAATRDGEEREAVS